MVMSTPPPYSVEMSQVPPPGGRSRPGMSIQPSTVYGALPSAGWTVTKPPELSETMPTSLTIVTSAAARAASTALPPARATCSPASAAASLGAAIATSGMREVSNDRARVRRRRAGLLGARRSGRRRPR